MADGTGIEWTDATWNPIRGCTRVSEGCRNCYAERVAARFSKPGMPYEGLAGFRVHVLDGDKEELRPYWTGKVRVVERALEQPLRWKRPRRIFVNSMSDLFHEALAFADILRIFEVMEKAKQHTFQVLTKRPQRAFEFCHTYGIGTVNKWPANVWLGVSVENQAAADERIPLLLETPAAVRFLSCEPLLGPVDLERVQWPQKHKVDVLRGGAWDYGRIPGFLQHSDMLTIDWVIAGGESGRGARGMHADWARSLRDQCTAANVPFFFKQWGEWAPMVDLGFTTPAGERLVGDPRLNSGKQVNGALIRIGKKAAGSLLDGVEHKAFPEVQP
jgi:protein gp37